MIFVAATIAAIGEVVGFYCIARYFDKKGKPVEKDNENYVMWDF
jgi:hypothetical protein